jgi:hypothetical protein
MIVAMNQAATKGTFLNRTTGRLIDRSDTICGEQVHNGGSSFGTTRFCGKVLVVYKDFESVVELVSGFLNI